MKDHGQDFLVGNRLSWADIHLLEAILMLEEKKSDALSGFPLLQVTYINSILYGWRYGRKTFHSLVLCGQFHKTKSICHSSFIAVLLYLL